MHFSKWHYNKSLYKRRHARYWFQWTTEISIVMTSAHHNFGTIWPNLITIVAKFIKKSCVINILFSNFDARGTLIPRIKAEHATMQIRTRTAFFNKHFYTSPHCKKCLYTEYCFRVLDSAQSPFYLELKASLYIKKLKPGVNKQIQMLTVNVICCCVNIYSHL